MFEGVAFLHKEMFWLLLLLIPAIVWYVFKHKQQTAEIKISSLKGFKTSKSVWPVLRHVLFVLRLAALVLLIIALARPQTVDVSTKTKKTEGIDIMIAVDISASMLAKDLKPNRLEALKEVASDFVKQRPNDRIGIVEYAGESYTKTPLTSDKSIVLSAISDIKYTGIVEGGTAIGMGLATAVNRLKDSNAKSKVVILLTDGVNNTGEIDPAIATELALEFGIKAYGVGIGTNGMALSPVALRQDGSFVYERVQVEIDDDLLTKIANDTGGKYFRATDNQSLSDIYDEINELETTEIEERKFYNYEEKFRPYAIAALCLIIFEFLLRHTIFRSFI